MIQNVLLPKGLNHQIKCNKPREKKWLGKLEKLPESIVKLCCYNLLNAFSFDYFQENFLPGKVSRKPISECSL